jgi:hypothetical protein
MNTFTQTVKSFFGFLSGDKETRTLQPPMFSVIKGIVFDITDDGYKGLLCGLEPLVDGFYFWREDGTKAGPFEVEADCKTALYSYFAKL